MHPREQVIRAMSRTLIVTAWADWCEDEEQVKRGVPTAHGGQDWMDFTPPMTAECQQAALIEAAVLYGSIKQAWGTEPWILVHHYIEANSADEAETYRIWGHYAVMSCLGHGVSWEDDHEKLQSLGKEYDLHGSKPYIENLDWNWEDELVD